MFRFIALLFAFFLLFEKYTKRQELLCYFSNEDTTHA